MIDSVQTMCRRAADARRSSNAAAAAAMSTTSPLAAASAPKANQCTEPACVTEKIANMVIDLPFWRSR